MDTVETSHISGAPPNISPTIKSRLEHGIMRRLLIIGALGVLVVLGLFLANVSQSKADWYWSAMFPVFFLVCLGHELIAGDVTSRPAWKIVLMQALHWLAPIVAVRIVFLQLARGQMDANEAAMMIVLLLAVTSFLAGLHFDHSFVWVGIILALAAVFSTEVQAYFWLIGLIAAALLGLAIFAGYMLRRRRRANTRTLASAAP
ncbi:MAG: hypothetical protein ACREP6_02140 [Candidatus Binataceae bacterium]